MSSSCCARACHVSEPLCNRASPAALVLQAMSAMAAEFPQLGDWQGGASPGSVPGQPSPALAAAACSFSVAGGLLIRAASAATTAAAAAAVSRAPTLQDMVRSSFASPLTPAAAPAASPLQASTQAGLLRASSAPSPAAAAAAVAAIFPSAGNEQGDRSSSGGADGTTHSGGRHSGTPQTAQLSVSAAPAGATAKAFNGRPLPAAGSHNKRSSRPQSGRPHNGGGSGRITAAVTSGGGSGIRRGRRPASTVDRECVQQLLSLAQ